MCGRSQEVHLATTKAEIRRGTAKLRKRLPGNLASLRKERTRVERKGRENSTRFLETCTNHVVHMLHYTTVVRAGERRWASRDRRGGDDTDGGYMQSEETTMIRLRLERDGKKRKEDKKHDSATRGYSVRCDRSPGTARGEKTRPDPIRPDPIPRPTVGRTLATSSPSKMPMPLGSRKEYSGTTLSWARTSK